MPYPEHEKLRAVKERSQVIGEFLDTGLKELGLTLCEATDLFECPWAPTPMSLETILAKYFNIDPNRLEEEKLAMLEELRSAQKGKE